MNSVATGRSFPEVVGRDALVEKRSAVDAGGAPKRTPIHDVIFRPTRPVPHEDGHVTEVARLGWDAIAAPIVQVHTTTILASPTWRAIAPIRALADWLTRMAARSARGRAGA